MSEVTVVLALMGIAVVVCGPLLVFADAYRTFLRHHQPDEQIDPREASR